MERMSLCNPINFNSTLLVGHVILTKLFSILSNIPVMDEHMTLENFQFDKWLSY